MLTSFFGKSNPINFIIAGVYICIGYVFAISSDILELLALPIIAQHFFFLVISFFSMLLLDFIIKKNKLTKGNTFGILFFTCFMVMLPAVFLNHSFLISNILILLALRRILSLDSEKNSEKKILDATIWITLASFFYFYSLLLFAVLFIAILKKPYTHYKLVLIPVVGFMGVFLLAIAVHFLIDDSFQWFFEWKTPISFDFSAYNKKSIVIPVAVIITLLIWTGTTRLLSITKLSKKERPRFLMQLFILGITICMILASSIKTGAELIFMFAPTAIIVSNYIEILKEFWFREFILWLVVLVPILVFIL